MRNLRMKAILSILAIFAAQGGSKAEESIIGCWSNIGKVTFPPNKSTGHASTGEFGDAVCFKDHGRIDTFHAGGFEALGSSGTFSYSDGHLDVTEDEEADGWPFAFKSDRCSASISTDQLTLTGCKDWEKGKALILRRGARPPGM